MEVHPEPVGARPGGSIDLLERASGRTRFRLATPTEVRAGGRDLRSALSERWRTELRWPFLVYGASRIGLIVLAIVCDLVFSHFVPKTSLAHEFSNWDGWWYVRLATLGYPTQVSHAQTTLGFFPLYSMVMWLVSHLFFCSYVISGLIVSLAGGLVATVLVQRLVTLWWGPQVARKAVLLFCVFPGSVVFAMDYSEGLLIPLAAGCMLALSRRRWFVAGALAGLATAIGPDALSLVALCAAASLLQLWRYGWRDGEARRSLAAPLLAPAGIIGFALFLKMWTGSAMASFTAQAKGWHESTTLVAIPALLAKIVGELGSPAHLAAVNLNNVVGLLGTMFLAVGLWWLWRERFSVPVEIWVFVAAMTFLMVTSAHVPPNPRLLITAFPLVLIYAKELRGAAFTRLVWISGACLILLSGLTYVGAVLRP